MVSSIKCDTFKDFFLGEHTNTDAILLFVGVDDHTLEYFVVCRMTLQDFEEGCSKDKGIFFRQGLIRPSDKLSDLVGMFLRSYRGVIHVFCVFSTLL